MTLNELLQKVFTYGPLTYENGYSDYVLMGQYLQLYREEILKTDEFKNIDELILLDAPISNVGDRFMTAESYMINRNSKFEGKCYLYSINLTPTVTADSDVTDYFVDGGSITPVSYDENDFSPYQIIGLKFSLGNITKQTSLFETRSQLHNLLDRILDDPYKYQIPGKRNVYVRGVFPKVSSPTNKRLVFEQKGEEIIL